MNNKMLIDASHPEETRVVVTTGNRIEEFDFESQDKKQLRGNIYLARVTRVEPSLQAAFIEYGGNRHGFLAFGEIHPDYYQIPVADRQALLDAEAEDARSDDDDDDSPAPKAEAAPTGRKRRSRRKPKAETPVETAATDESEVQPVASDDAASEDKPTATDDAAAADNGSDESGTSMAAAVEPDETSEALPESEEASPPAKKTRRRSRKSAAKKDVSADDSDNGDGDGSEVESVGAEDALEELPNRKKTQRRHYKIQEVIKRRQILLVQVVKEERGNKGAALTTYLSLAGRYSVLMPNTARGGGISRKITNVQDRKRLKEVVKELDVPQGMGVILRTAGANRTKAEVKRDYEYLMRLWERVRTLTLESTAPSLVYEEGSLIKRSVRDLYNKEIGEVLVSGDEGYREAKDFMRMLMPSHAKVVQPYRDDVPIFARNGIEAQLDRMLQPQVTLKSGGYIIINQTEALVAIDVNSGRSTREHSIEDTALQTNLESAEEIARQLRLRDLAGLIVIDFIDMEEKRNNRAVEKRLKDCLKNDRARIQVGRISHFGLMEMSRQRIRASVLDSTMQPCAHCNGTGHIRSESSIALHVIRSIEEYLIKDSRHHITVRTPVATAIYVLNNKRQLLADLEQRFGLSITIDADDSVGTQYLVISRDGVVERTADNQLSESVAEFGSDADAEDNNTADTADHTVNASETGEEENGSGRRRRKRRRRRGGRDREDASVTATSTDEQTDSEEDAGAESQSATLDAGDETKDEDRKKRRRGKRGGKRNRGSDDERDGEAEASEAATVDPADTQVSQPDDSGMMPTEAGAPEEPATEAPEKPARRPRRRAAAKADVPTDESTASQEPTVSEGSDNQAEIAGEAEPDTAKPVKKRASRRKDTAATCAAEPVEPVVTSVVSDAEPPAGDEKPRKGGWWQRRSFF